MARCVFNITFPTFLRCQKKRKKKNDWLPESCSSGVGLNFLFFFFFFCLKAGSGFVVCWHLGYLHLMKAYSKYQYQYPKTKDPRGMNTNGFEGREVQEEEVKSWCSWQKKGKCFLVVKANLRRVVFEGSSSWLSKIAFIQRPLSRFYPILFPALPLTRLDGVFCRVRFSLISFAPTFTDLKRVGR